MPTSLRYLRRFAPLARLGRRLFTGRLPLPLGERGNQRALQFFQRRLGKNRALIAQQVIRMHVIAAHQFHAFQVRELSSRLRFSTLAASTTRAVPSTFNASSAVRNSLVLGSFSSKFSTTVNCPSASLAARAERRAPSSFLRGKSYSYDRGCGPCTVPPCRHSGDRMEPTRARPVPFCRHSFFPDPETSLRFLVA